MKLHGLFTLFSVNPAVFVWTKKYKQNIMFCDELRTFYKQVKLVTIIVWFCTKNSSEINIFALAFHTCHNQFALWCLFKCTPIIKALYPMTALDNRYAINDCNSGKLKKIWIKICRNYFNQFSWLSYLKIYQFQFISHFQQINDLINGKKIIQQFVNTRIFLNIHKPGVNLFSTTSLIFDWRRLKKWLMFVMDYF